MRHRDQRGASLVLVLALITFLGIILPAVLGLAITGSRVTVPVKEDRRAVYAATSAIEAAVALAQAEDDVGTVLAGCPDVDLTVDGFDVTVECAYVPAECDVNNRRSVSYLATVRDPEAADPVETASATVHLPPAAFFAFQPAEVRTFEIGTAATSPPAPPPLPPCEPPDEGPGDPPPTPTPVEVVVAWSDTRPDPQSGNRWRAEATLNVTGRVPGGGGDQFVPMPGARATVEVQHLRESAPDWSVPEVLVVETTDAGTFTVHSAPYGLTSSGPQGRVNQIRLRVTSVEQAPPGWEPGPTPPEVVVDRPAS